MMVKGNFGRYKLWIYLLFFAVLLGGFYVAISNEQPFRSSKLAVINNVIPDFNFVNQDNRKISRKQTDGKVYVAEYFFTTCQGICPKMNANMRRVFEEFKNEDDFLILSHTCMPEVDSVPVLKEYEKKILSGELVRKDDGSYRVINRPEEIINKPENPNWHFLTGDKAELYKLARQGYKVDDGKPDSVQINDQFIHTQFFALVDRHGRVRAIYDGLVEAEVSKLLKDIPQLLKEKYEPARFLNGFSNNPG